MDPLWRKFKIQMWLGEDEISIAIREEFNITDFISPWDEINITDMTGYTRSVMTIPRGTGSGMAYSGKLIIPKLHEMIENGRLTEKSNNIKG